MGKVFSSFCLIAVSSILVVAQENRASIAGSVTDSSGGAVPAARVVVTSVERNTTSETLTTETGRYVVGFLIPGAYNLAVEHPGFRKHIQENIQLGTDEKLG